MMMTMQVLRRTLGAATAISLAVGMSGVACSGLRSSADIENPAPADAGVLADSANELWPNGEIPYEIHPSFAADSMHIKTVMRRWENGTPVRFIPKRTSDLEFVHITRGRCVTYDSGPRTIVSADTSCVGHELGHGLGLTHEHQRPDRDRFVNVKPPWYWFGKGKSQYKIIPQRLCRPYDLGSIMHYRVKYITAKPGYKITQQNNRPSPQDLLSIRQLYGAAPCEPPVYTDADGPIAMERYGRYP